MVEENDKYRQLTEVMHETKKALLEAKIALTSNEAKVFYEKLNVVEGNIQFVESQDYECKEIDEMLEMLRRNFEGLKSRFGSALC